MGQHREPGPSAAGGADDPVDLAWLRILGGLGILGLLVWWLGTEPFLDGVRMVTGWAIAMAAGIGVLTTVCYAWRWRLVAGGLGVKLPLASAVAAYYRSQFLNTTLPGGVIGDVHRAVRHGLVIGDVARAIRVVVLERIAGQAVLVAVGVIVLFALPSPVRSHMPVAAAVLAGAGIGTLLLARALRHGGSSRWARALRRAGSDLRAGLFARRTGVGVLLTSAMGVVAHLATFVLSARAAGSLAPLTLLVPLGMLALLAMGLPLSVAGWGPREGVAAWAFGAAGLTAGQGVRTAVVYGVLALVASLPGAGVLILRSLRRVSAQQRADLLRPRVPEVQQGGVAHG